jgi:hypothetical protein
MDYGGVLCSAKGAEFQRLYCFTQKSTHKTVDFSTILAHLQQ